MSTSRVDSAAWFDEAFAAAPLMAILRGMGAHRSLELAHTAWDLGIDVVEIPLQNSEDHAALAAVVAAGADRGEKVRLPHVEHHAGGIKVLFVQIPLIGLHAAALFLHQGPDQFHALHSVSSLFWQFCADFTSRGF